MPRLPPHVLKYMRKNKNCVCVSPGSQLPAIYQCLNKSQPRVAHMAVLHRTALGSEAPRGLQLLQFVQCAF